MAHKVGKRALIVVLALLLLVVLPIAPASAQGPRINCLASGNVNVAENPDGTWSWAINGLGPCLDFLQGPYQVSFTGTGSSASLGLCDGLVVTDLAIDVTLLLLNVRTGVLQTIVEQWHTKLTTFPLVTPFFVRVPGAPGVGAIFTRVLLSCPPAGSSGATFVWTQAT